MSAPDTNVKKQERRHKVPLMGMKSVVVFAALALIALVFYTVLQTEDTGEETIDRLPAVEGTVRPAIDPEVTVQPPTDPAATVDN